MTDPATMPIMTQHTTTTTDAARFQLSAMTDQASPEYMRICADLIRAKEAKAPFVAPAGWALAGCVIRVADGWLGHDEPIDSHPAAPGRIVTVYGSPDGCAVDIRWGNAREVGSILATYQFNP